MSDSSFLVQPDEAEVLIGNTSPLVIDLCHKDNYARAHLPGAINLDYQALVDGRPPAPGHLPDLSRLQNLVDTLGISEETEILVYDDEGNGKASRFIWVLESIRHQHYKLLDGGMHGWANEGHPLEQTVNQSSSSVQKKVQIVTTPNAAKEEVLKAIDQPDTVILDARSPEEYTGLRGGTRFGHIPGSVNLNWLDTIDQNNNMRLRPADQLMQMYAEIGVNPDKNIITHCQTHHRSSHTYAVLKHLGFKNVKGYSGSWAEWSSDPSLPIA